MFKQNFIINVITSILGIVLGLLLCFSDAEDFLRFVFAGVAIYMFLLAIPSLILISKEENPKEKTRIYVIAFTLIAIGLVLLIYPKMVATIIGGTLLLIIPGIIAAIGLTFYTYVVADNPELDVTNALRKCWEMTLGFKMDLFVFYLSFIGWAILAPFTLGI